MKVVITLIFFLIAWINSTKGIPDSIPKSKWNISAAVGHAFAFKTFSNDPTYFSFSEEGYSIKLGLGYLLNNQLHLSLTLKVIVYDVNNIKAQSILQKDMSLNKYYINKLELPDPFYESLHLCLGIGKMYELWSLSIEPNLSAGLGWFKIKYSYSLQLKEKGSNYTKNIEYHFDNSLKAGFLFNPHVTVRFPGFRFKYLRIVPLLNLDYYLQYVTSTNRYQSMDLLRKEEIISTKQKGKIHGFNLIWGISIKW